MFAFVVGFSFAGFSAAGSDTSGAEKPNILWIVTEDIGCDMACYGTEGVHTPILDQLAAEGAVLITRSVLNEPETIRRGKQALKPMPEPAERIYYIEVAIGNFAWHRMKILVYEDEGRKKVKILSSEAS